MKRIYTDVINSHLQQYEQMIFISGPRQVGKTTIVKNFIADKHTSIYLNWDNVANRQKILEILTDAEYVKLNNNLAHAKLIALDEIHKFPHWKNDVKGFYDAHKDEYKFLLTGSARLNVYRKGGDSMMGRYFNYTIHPLSLGELARPTLCTSDIQPPTDAGNEIYDYLYRFGGYPEPLLKQSDEFHRMWSNTRFSQLFREEIRDSEDIRSLSQLELLAYLLQGQACGLLNHASMANKVQVTGATIKKWLNMLESFYFCFSIKPWTKNISRSLIKESKVYLCDWSTIKDPGMRFENMLVCHVLKSVNLWNEIGLGDYGLYYIRTKDKKEVDFVVTKDGNAWILIEAKLFGNQSISRHLIYFQDETKAPHALQVVHNSPYIDKSCFTDKAPTIVPARTFLSQLV